jgi:hypothetical protein
MTYVIRPSGCSYSAILDLGVVIRGVSVGGSQGPVVKSWRRASSLLITPFGGGVEVGVDQHRQPRPAQPPGRQGPHPHHPVPLTDFALRRCGVIVALDDVLGELLDAWQGSGWGGCRRR